MYQKAGWQSIKPLALLTLPVAVEVAVAVVVARVQFLALVCTRFSCL